jgi:hypothetical protein
LRRKAANGPLVWRRPTISLVPPPTQKRQQRPSKIDSVLIDSAVTLSVLIYFLDATTSRSASIYLIARSIPTNQKRKAFPFLAFRTSRKTHRARQARVRGNWHAPDSCPPLSQKPSCTPSSSFLPNLIRFLSVKQSNTEKKFHPTIYRAAARSEEKKNSASSAKTPTPLTLQS